MVKKQMLVIDWLDRVGVIHDEPISLLEIKLPLGFFDSSSCCDVLLGQEWRLSIQTRHKSITFSGYIAKKSDVDIQITQKHQIDSEGIIEREFITTTKQIQLRSIDIDQFIFNFSSIYRRIGTFSLVSM